MDLVLFQNVLNVSAKIIVRTSNYVEKIHYDFQESNQNINAIQIQSNSKKKKKKNKKYIDCYFHKKKRCLNENCPYNHDF
jgi:hypothetical protein